MRKSWREQHGFTHLEIGIVIGLVIIFALVLLPRVFSNKGKLYDQQRKTDLKTLSQALNTYGKDHHAYPSAGGISCKIGTVDCLVTALTGGTAPYLPKLPKDPLGSRYTYTPSPNGCTDAACVGYTVTAHLQNGSETLVSGPSIH